MKQYELLYVIPATHAETELQPVLDGVTKELTKLEAKITRNDMVGKVKLAYPIAKVRHGYYVVVDMEIEPSKLSVLDKALRHHSDVIRHQLAVKDTKLKPVMSLSSVERIDRERPPRKRTERTSTDRQAAAAPKKDAGKSDVDMEEIDKKLDKIVEGKIL